MKGGADGQRNGPLGAGGLGEFARAADRTGVAGDDDLLGRIEVGCGDDLALRGFGQYACEFAVGEFEDRGHGADALRNCFLHVPAALFDQAHGVGKGDGSSRHQSRVLAQAVARHVLRLHPFGFEHPERRHRYREQRRLGVFGLFQLVLRPLETQLGKGESERLIGFREHGGSNRKCVGERFPHAGELRSLAGEKKRKF